MSETHKPMIQIVRRFKYNDEDGSPKIESLTIEHKILEAQFFVGNNNCGLDYTRIDLINVPSQGSLEIYAV